MLNTIHQTVAITSYTTYSPPDTPSQTITYLKLASNFAPGNLEITAGAFKASYTLPVVQYGG
jgi:hypothetical protein